MTNLGGDSVLPYLAKFVLTEGFDEDLDISVNFSGFSTRPEYQNVTSFLELFQMSAHRLGLCGSFNKPLVERFDMFEIVRRYNSEVRRDLAVL